MHIATASGTPAVVISDVSSVGTIPIFQFRRQATSVFSLQIDFPSNNRARFSIGDAVAGYELTGGNLGLTGGRSIEFGGITGQVATGIIGSIQTDNNNGQLTFSTRGSGTTAERMRIFNDGNIGINTTTNAGFKLDVNGKLRAIGADYGVYLGFNVDVQNGLIANALYIRSGSNTLGGLFPYNTATGGIQLQSASSQPIIRGAFNEDTTIFPARNTTDNLGDVVIQGGGSERARFKANGRVGIGTTTPFGKFDVKDGEIFVTTSTDANLRSRLTYQGLYVSRASDGGYPENIISTSSAWLYNSRNAHTFFRDTIPLLTIGALSATAGININTNGNVLINSATDAGFKLDVNGTARVQGNLTAIGAIGSVIEHTALTNYNGFGGFQLNVSGGIERAFVKLQPNSGEFKIGTASGGGYFLTLHSGGSEAMRIFTTGNIGINTTTDAGFKLDVNGTARVTGNFQLENYLRFNNNNTSINSTSSTLILTAQNLVTSDIILIPFRQVNISNTGSYTAQTTAILQVDSTTKGFLPPRMTTTQKNAIVTPATGLMVYDNVLNRPCFYDGTTWITL